MRNKILNLNLIGEPEVADEDYEDEDDGETTKLAKPPPASKKPKKLPNMFNFCERDSLTYPIPVRVSICFY